MPYKITRTDSEITDLIERCMDAEMVGTSKYPGMSYEQGIKAALDWLIDTGADDYHPLDD